MAVSGRIAAGSMSIVPRRLTLCRWSYRISSAHPGMGSLNDMMNLSRLDPRCHVRKITALSKSLIQRISLYCSCCRAELCCLLAGETSAEEQDSPLHLPYDTHQSKRRGSSHGQPSQQLHCALSVPKVCRSGTFSSGNWRQLTMVPPSRKLRSQLQPRFK